jgi:class 3 adenylate cyclase/tetratricopeptide (TPR) repeat protein
MNAAVTATFLFTDLVGSTALSQRLGHEQATDLRQVHFGLLRTAAGSAGGVEVKNLGDGLMLMFTSPSRSLSCAVAIQQAVERHNRRSSEPLAVRIGIAAGEAVEEDGDYFGDPVVEAARLCAAAAGGQILATDTLRALVGRHANQELRPVGDLELKGLSEPVPTVEVVWEPEIGLGGESVPLPARLLVGATESLFGFFGRQSELDAVAQVRKASQADPGARAVFITGEAGIGKSTLTSHAARVAHAEGAIVVYGRCDEDFAVPYQPWIEAATHLVHHRRAPLDAMAGPQRSALGRLVPMLGVEDAVTTVDPDSERLLLMDAIAQLFVLASDDAPVVLVLDDLHWADLATLQVLRRFVTSGLPAPVTIIGTYRDTDLSTGDALTALIADLNREPSASRIAIAGLGEHEIVELVEAAAGHDLDDEGIGLAHALRHETAGNPFFTAELLRHLGESGAFYQDDDGRWVLRGELRDLGLPSSVREVVGRRVARLGDETVRVLSFAAVIGADFDVDVLAELAGVDPDAVLELLDEAAAAVVVVETGTAGRYRFTHALVQHTLYSDLSAARRQRAHLRLADALESTAIDGDSERLAELAHHYLAATRPTETVKALTYAEQAGDAALAALAPDDALKWYSKALELLDQQGEGVTTRSCRLLIGVGAAQRQIGDPEFRDTLVSAGTLAQRLGDADLLVASVLTGSGAITMLRDADPEWLALTYAALDALGPADSAQRALLLSAAIGFMSAFDVEERAVLAREAMEVAGRAGDDTAIAITGHLIELTEVSRAAQGGSLADRIAAADRSGSLSLGAMARRLGVYVALAQADLALARDLFHELQAIAAETNLPAEATHAKVVETLMLTIACDLERADEAAAEALRLGTEIGVAESVGLYGGQLFELRRQQGRLDEIAEFFVGAVAENPQIQVLALAVATLHLETGDLASARALVVPMFDGDTVSFPRDQTWLLAMVHCAEIVARLGDADYSAMVRRELAPYAGEVASPGGVIEGAVDRCLGLLAMVFGEYDEAEANFESALQLHERLEAPFWTAITQLDLADALRARGGVGDTSRADALVEAALETAHEYGLAGLERRVNEGAPWATAS